MSKKKRTAKASRKAPLYNAKAIAAQLGAMTRGMTPAYDAAAIAAQYGAMTRGMYAKPKKKKSKLSKAERAARGRVLAAYRANAARAARLPGKKKRTTKKKTSKRPASKAAPRAASRSTAPRTARSNKRPPTVTANQVIAKATRTALTRWLCEGARRSGCGAGGSRVVTGSGSFKRIRPPRFMTAG